jgi:hypothetical protein
MQPEAKESEAKTTLTTINLRIAIKPVATTRVRIKTQSYYSRNNKFSDAISLRESSF